MYFDRTLTIRTSDELHLKIEKLCETFSEKYDNPSHLIRCLVFKTYREEMEKLEEYKKKQNE